VGRYVSPPDEVTNDSDDVRTVLLLDIWRRGMPLDMRLLSHLLIFIVRVMARLPGLGEAIG
jgi:aspartate beta-hydroxylase